MSTREERIDIELFEFDTADEAVQHADAGGGAAILLGGKYFVVREADARRLEAFGSVFAYLCDHEGRIVTVPVNDRADG
jgi:hypothetical protein